MKELKRLSALEIMRWLGVIHAGGGRVLFWDVELVPDG